MSRIERIEWHIFYCEDRRLMRLLNREWWREFFKQEEENKMIPPVLTAYTAGAATAVIAMLAGAKIRTALQHREPLSHTPKPAPVRAGILNEHADPRAEAQAILEISNWNFADAYSWTRAMMRDDVTGYWYQVAECIEIFQAGKGELTA